MCFTVELLNCCTCVTDSAAVCLLLPSCLFVYVCVWGSALEACQQTSGEAAHWFLVIQLSDDLNTPDFQRLYTYFYTI